jgi:hypothetical protein
MEMMLQAANTLTADDVDCLRGSAPVGMATAEPEDADEAAVTAATDVPTTDEEVPAVSEEPAAPTPQTVRTRPRRTPPAAPAASAVSSRGEYERQRTRESKVSTECIGHERQKHDWWPVGTELIGKLGSDTFTATVVENPQVKSGRSILITSGPATGKVCLTPTRAAIEATEVYRQAKNLGRGGGVTNGWEFWESQQTA